MKTMERITAADWQGWANIMAAAGFPAERLAKEQRAMEIACDLFRVWRTPQYERDPKDIERYDRTLQQLAGQFGFDEGNRFYLAALNIAIDELARQQTLASIATNPRSIVASTMITPEAEIARLRREIAELRATQERR